MFWTILYQISLNGRDPERLRFLNAKPIAVGVFRFFWKCVFCLRNEQPSERNWYGGQVTWPGASTPWTSICNDSVRHSEFRLRGPYLKTLISALSFSSGRFTSCGFTSDESVSVSSGTVVATVFAANFTAYFSYLRWSLHQSLMEQVKAEITPLSLLE